MTDMQRIRDCVSRIYPSDDVTGIMDRIEHLFRAHRDVLLPAAAWQISENDAILITYPDQVTDDDHTPLDCLSELAWEFLEGLVSGLHILPFYPSSSDDGFAVIDYRAVDPSFGDWADIRRLGNNFRLMFDAVVNHTSVGSSWFKGFLRDEGPYRRYFVCVEGDPDLSTVVRPRTLPLLTTFATSRGDRQVWTTFSADQVDLDYSSPDVLLEILDLLLFYVEHGASFIRLDAIAYIWKEIGTSCVHRPEVHAIVSLIRAMLDGLAPHVRLITETNVGHSENLKYLGDGTNEAHWAYNFALPPLVLHAFHSGQAITLSEWASSIALPSDGVAFFNVLATHDGIGLNGARGILSDDQIEQLIARIEPAGGQVSWKSNSDGTSSPYEINANYYDALAGSASSSVAELEGTRFLTAHAIMLAFRGVPGIYFHSMFGSRGWQEGVVRTGKARSINREKLNYTQMRAELATPTSLRSRTYVGMKRLLDARRLSSAFAPHAEQQVVRAGSGIFAFTRTHPESGERVLCIHNVTAQAQIFAGAHLELDGRTQTYARDLIGSRRIDLGSMGGLTLEPYQSMWLRRAE